MTKTLPLQRTRQELSFEWSHLEVSPDRSGMLECEELGVASKHYIKYRA